MASRREALFRWGGPLALALSLLAGGAWLSAPARAQQRGAGWEHKVVLWDPAEYEQSAEYKAAVARESPRTAVRAIQEQLLQFYGKEGWELVAIDRHDRANLLYFYLKRRAP